VQGLLGALALLDRKRGLMDEHVGVSRRLEHRARRTRVAGEHDLAPGPRRAEHLLSAHRRAVGKLHSLSTLQATEERPLGDTEAPCLLEVESSRTRLLDERIAICRDPMLDLERLDPIVAPIDAVAGAKLHQRKLIAQPPENSPEDPEELVQPGRAVDRERHFASPQGERLQHPGQAEVMVCVVVRDEDLGQFHEADR
jgi:hypothetical protein